MSDWAAKLLKAPSATTTTTTAGTSANAANSASKKTKHVFKPTPGEGRPRQKLPTRKPFKHEHKAPSPGASKKPFSRSEVLANMASKFQADLAGAPVHRPTEAGWKMNKKSRSDEYNLLAALGLEARTG